MSIIIGVSAQEEGNETTENLNEENQTITETEETETESNETITTEENTALNQTNTTDIEETNQTTAPEEQASQDVVDFIITLSPIEVNQGDAILTVKVENNGTTVLSNLIPLITGKGFSAYDVVPIEEVAPGKTASSYVLGQFRDVGAIVLTIKINGKTATQTITVRGTTAQSTEELETAKKEALATLSEQVELLENDYEQLETQIAEKEADYFLADVNLDELKEYIRDAQSRMLAGQVEEANISIILATTEYNDVKNKVETAQKKSFFDKIKDNILLISTLAGAILTLFAFFEFVKKKQTGLYQKIKEFKVDPNTKIEVHKKKENSKETEKKEANKENKGKSDEKKEGKGNKNKEKSEQKSDEDDVPKLDVWELEL